MVLFRCKIIPAFGLLESVFAWGARYGQCTVIVMEVNIVIVYVVNMSSTLMDAYLYFLPQAAFSMLYEGAA